MEKLTFFIFVIAIFNCKLDFSTAQVTRKQICSLPLESGMCRAGHQAWGFSPEKRQCIRFTWGGCDGNKNRFETKQACEEFCSFDETELESLGANQSEFEEVQGVCSCKCPKCSDPYSDRKLRADTFFEGKRAFPRLDELGNEMGNLLFR